MSPSLTLKVSLNQNIVTQHFSSEVSPVQGLLQYGFIQGL